MRDCYAIIYIRLVERLRPIMCGLSAKITLSRIATRIFRYVFINVETEPQHIGEEQEDGNLDWVLMLFLPNQGARGLAILP
jgi:hypothetical protein